jgi:peptidoglycan-N-acetylglucosamine deacetylase
VVGNTRPGSIILSHDGGGPREQTLAAYRSIIPTLKRRGYRFATVPELLGLKPTYG